MARQPASTPEPSPTCRVVRGMPHLPWNPSDAETCVAVLARTALNPPK